VPTGGGIVIRALCLRQVGEVRSKDKAPLLTHNTPHPTLPLPSSSTAAGSSSLSRQSTSPHSDHYQVPQSNHTPDRHHIHPMVLCCTRRVTFNLRSIEATPLTPSKCPSCQSLPLKNVPDSLPPRHLAGIVNSTCSTKLNQMETSSFRSSSKPLKATRCDIPRTTCGQQKHSLNLESDMENNGTDTPSGTTTTSSGRTWLSGRLMAQTTTPSGLGGTPTMPQPSGTTTLQMLKGPVGTNHLRKVACLYQSITRTYNSIPKDSSTLLPSIDSYITTLALAALSDIDNAP
jgi:hypothetical protein